MSEYDDDVYGTRIAGNLPCISCTSSDAMSLYENEHSDYVDHSAHCFSCDKTFRNNRLAHEESLAAEYGIVKIDYNSVNKFNKDTPRVEREPKVKNKPVITEQEEQTLLARTIKPTANIRGIRPDVLNKYGIRVEVQDGQVIRHFYPVTKADKLAGYKCRTLPKSFAFYHVGDYGNTCQLFGTNIASNQSKYVLLTAGELDAPAAYQMLSDSRRDKSYDSISVVCGTTGEGSLAGQIKHNYTFFERFDIIVINMDNDEAGDAALEKICKILPREKIRIMNNPNGCKDPCDALQNGKSKDFVNNFFSAKEYVPTGILGSSSLEEGILAELMLEKIPLPPFMCKLQEMMAGGIPLGRIVNFGAASGGGKCHGKDTPILMYDGSVKMVQDIIKGDKLMGDDGSPRNVLSTCKGRENLYKVKQNKGIDYVVNESHILALKCSETEAKYFKGDRFTNINVKDYLNLNKTRRRALRGYKANLVELGKDVKVFEPYMLGLWLADGTSKKAQITFNNKDQELIDEFYNFAERNNYTTNISSSNYRENCTTIDVAGGFYSFLKTNNLYGNKHIPEEYLMACYEDRLQMIAGILDGDGYLQSNGYDIVLKQKDLAEGLAFLCRSVGLYVTITDKFSKCDNFEGAWYKRLHINGNTGIIPNKLSRKKATPKSCKGNVTGISIESLGEGDYYGFELDGNHLYCLSDMTVTHNTTIINEMVYHWLFNSPYKVGVVSLELNAAQYGIAMLSRHTETKIDLFDTAEKAVEFYNDPETVAKRKELFATEDGQDRFVLIDERSGTVKDLMNKIEELILMCDCKVIIIDPLSDLLDELPNEEQASLMRWMKQKVTEHNVTFIDIMHVRKNSGSQESNSRGRELSEEDFMGSSTVFKSAAANILFSRNKHEECAIKRNTLIPVMSKCRWTGNTGYAGRWYYEFAAHKLHDYETYFTDNPHLLDEEQDDLM